MKFVTLERRAGEATVAPDLFRVAWEECVELQVVDKQTWIERTTRTVESFDRYEIGMYDGLVPVGGITLSRDMDCHVGECLTVMTQYVMPAYRNSGVSLRCMREAIALARHHKFPVLAYTHRVKDWTYLTRYKLIGYP